MSIDFKKPKYILPLIALPFLCLFFYIYQSTFAKQPGQVQGADSLQGTVAEASKEVQQRSLSDKLQAYQQQFKSEGQGYTAIGQIQEEEAQKMHFDDLYNEKEKRTLDSIQQAIKKAAANKPGQPNDYKRQDQELADALNAMRQPARQLKQEVKETDPMELFRQQMALVDSVNKANDPDYQAEQQRKAAIEARILPEVKADPVNVRKTRPSDAVFNTVRPERDDELIQAIIDESITGYADSRLRIRLLDDITAGKAIIIKGTYLYAEISGFTGQRVKLTIRSVMQHGQIIPVQLEVYDNDGLPGLFVPASAFREFTRELGSSSAQGVTLQQQAENNNQMVMSLIQRMFSSTTSAISKQIRKNKAKIKYNTLVYLIDPQSLHE